MNETYSWAEKPSQTAFPIAKAGYPFIWAAALTTGTLALLGIVPLALLGLVVTLFICAFFRDPDRAIPNGEGLLVAPADGKVVAIDTLAETPHYQGKCRRVGIFMNIFNVHVNRVPYEGKLTAVAYQPGRFLPADRDSAATANEHNALTLKTDDGHEICFVQIAGLVARRIICHVQPGDRLVRGQRIGLICFGSRVDVYLPMDTGIQVRVGDKLRAGTSIIGAFPT
ncbi:MAG: phosphatidylserine decarboxylase family protein [Desulfosarcinaceae bacterium]|nr:phosphatidylserine decarboxylase family protein [Desulfosarcinaceae bacterium]